MVTPIAGKRTQRFLLKKESVYGTLESVIDTRLSALRAEVQPMKEVEYFAAQGDAVPNLTMVNDDYTVINVTGKMSFQDIIYVLESLFGAPTTTNPGTLAYQHVFAWDGTEVVNPASFSMTYGDRNAARSAAGMIFNSLGFNVARDGSLQMTAAAFAKALATGAVSYPRESSFTLTITATGGNYTITWEGQTTGNIAYNANAATILSALEALSNVAPGDLTVTGTGPWVVKPTSTGAWAETDITATINTGGLTGGSATLTETQAGGPVTVIPAVPMGALMFDIYVDDAWADLGNTHIGTIYAMDFQGGDRWARARPVNSSQATDGVSEAEGDETGQSHGFNFTAGADSYADSLLDDLDANTMKFIRIEANGAANSIESGQAYLFRWDMAYLLGEASAYGTVQGGVHALPFVGRLAKDPTSGNCLEVTVKNKLSGTA